MAILESVVFLLMENLELMRGGDAPLRRIVVTGGHAQIDGLCQRLADLSGLPVVRPELSEATALGAARLTGGISAMAPQPEASFTPEEDAALQRRYARWREALRAAL